MQPCKAMLYACSEAYISGKFALVQEENDLVVTNLNVLLEAFSTSEFKKNPEWTQSQNNAHRKKSNNTEGMVRERNSMRCSK